MNEWEVRTWTDLQALDITVKIVIFRFTGTDHEVFNPVSRSIKKLTEDEPCPDEYILKFPEFMADKIFKSMAELFDKRGIKTENDHKIAGTLEATKFHLEDMRKLLKLK